MIKRFISFFSNRNSEIIKNQPTQYDHAPESIVVDGLAPFLIANHITVHNGLPLLNWDAVQDWVATGQSDEQQGMAWAACELAWLKHFNRALGPGYNLFESGTALLVSTQEPNVARAALDYMGRTLGKITKVLDGIAQVPPWGKDILIVFDDADSYYNYVSYYYPDEEREFAYSGGMHINTGCSHYVTIKRELQSVEPVIAHEMTHGCLSHLPLPLWLNEGLAVNTEIRLVGNFSVSLTPQQMRKKHLSFWGSNEIQEFWSGKSFERTDDGNLLSYDLARIMVEQMAKDWERFTKFVLHADWRDSGAEAAEQYLDVDLGKLVCLLLEKPDDFDWSPEPQSWKGQHLANPG